jgi:hypothetical protein
MIINQTERAIVEYVRERTKEELSKRIPCIDNIDYRRLTYLLIEDRMAMYKEAKVDETIPSILAEFGINSPHTYYNWYEKWHKVYQAM